MSKKAQIRWGWIWVAPFLLAVFLGSLVASKPISPLAVRSEDLTCAEVAQVFEWSQERYGGKRVFDAKSREFSDKVSETYVNKLDPYKILFTTAEVDAFKKRGQEGWKQLSSRRNCNYFDTWLSAHWNEAKQRMQKRLDSVEYNFVFASASKKELADFRPTKHREFAASEEILVKRLRDFLAHAAETASPFALKNYGGSQRKYLESVLEEVIFETPFAPHGLLAKAALGAMDPFSTYLSTDEFTDFYSDLSGGTSGVGVRVRKVPGGYLVEKVLKDSPAGKSNKIAAGDIITEIDHLNLESIPRPLVKHLFLGPANSKVTLRLKKTTGGIASVELKREVFAFEDGKVYHRWNRTKNNKKILSIFVPSFYGRAGMVAGSEERSSAEDLKNILVQATKKNSNTAGVVLDLRGNPGGYLEEAVTMASYFLGDRPVVAVVEKTGKRILREENAKAIYTGPLVVLVDQDTASASEVLAGALKDYGVAVVVGNKHTFGKGSVQKLYHLDDEVLTASMDNASGNGVVKLTTSVFYGPSGHTPNDGGVAAHIVLPSSSTAPEGDHKALAPNTAPELPLAEMPRNDGFQSRIDTLEKLSKERMKSAVAEGLDEDEWELEEAISVAIDSARLSEKDETAFSVVTK